MDAASDPVLSICIPSYNRSALLGVLLRKLDVPDLLPFPFEVIVADNASTDPAYQEAIAGFSAKHYPCRYVRRAQNIGPFRNVWGSYRLARGEFCLHLSDDDFLMFNELADIVATMRNAPDCVATFAAWQMYDEEAGAVVRAPSFEDLSATQADAAMLARKMTEWSLSVPENGVFRTSTLSLALYQAPSTYIAHRLLQRLLLTGRVDFRSKPFYRVLARHAGESGPRNHVSGALGVEGWSGMARGVAVFHHWATGEPLCDMPATGSALLYLTLLRNAVYEASNRGQFLQATDMMDYVDSLTSSDMFTDVQRSHIRHMGGLDAIASEIACLPGIAEIHAIALDQEAEPLRQLFVSRDSPLAFHQSAYPTADLETASAALVVPSDAMREQLVALYALRPGFVFSLEGAQRCFAR